MSYRSRIYRHRDAHTHDESAAKPFFSKQHDDNNNSSKQSFFQAKLAISKPGDSYEREADSVANAVVNKQTQTPVVQQKEISGIQRLSTSKEEDKLSTNDARMKMDKDIQRKPMPQEADMEKEKLKGIQKKDDPLKEKEKKKTVAPVQKKPEANASTASPQVSSRIESSAGKGNSLPPKTLNEMSSSFGVDFSNVNIHKDSEAAIMNKELQAQAFTYGNDIYFNEGKYNPENSEGKFLLAHELTHVVQQGAVEKASLTSNADIQIERQPLSPETNQISPEEEQKLVDAQFWRQWALSKALLELSSLARALRMSPDPVLLSYAYGPTLSIIGTWLNVGLRENAPQNSVLGQSGSDYFTDVIDVAIQHIRNNLLNRVSIDKRSDDLCTISGVRGFFDPIFGGIHICSDCLTNCNVQYLGLVLNHEYFHSIGLVHGPEEAILNIDSCAYSTSTEDKLYNPYCMTGLVEHIAYGSVWW